MDSDAKSSSVSPPFDSQFKVIIDKSDVSKQPEQEDVKPTIKSEPVVSHYDLSKEKVPHACSSCGTENTTEQYCSTTKTDFYLCRSCFTQGKYPEDQSNGHFVLEKLETEEPEAWDENEESLLKEGMKLHKDDWEQIAKHVGTRTHDECVLHFLQLPNKDPYDGVEVEKIGLLQYDEGHPSNIMDAVAFLASMVDPKVAAAAAGQEYEQEVEEEQVKKEQEEEDTLRNLSNTLISAKLKQFSEQIARYDALQSIVDKQKRHLEKEKHLLERDQSAVKQRILGIRQEMAKNMTPVVPQPAPQVAVTTSITPAQLQQQLMFSPQHLQQQQQYHLQMQMQMQQQGQPRLPGQQFNHMMTM